MLGLYALVICVWAVLLSELWKRKEHKLSLAFGMNNFEKKEVIRSQFKADYEVNFYGPKILYFNYRKRVFRNSLAFLVCFALCGCVIGTIAITYRIQNYMSSQNERQYDLAPYVFSLLNGFQVLFFTAVYNSLSTKLTEYENHRLAYCTLFIILIDSPVSVAV